MASGNGILGSRALVANTPQSIAQPLNSDGVVANLNLVNRNQYEVRVSVAVTDTVNTFDDDAYYIEYNTVLYPGSALERSGITVGAGQYITVSTNSDGVTAVAWGIHYGDPQTLPAAIPTA